MSTGTPWTADHDAVLKALWGKHFTHHIGAALKRTKNSIVGRAHRLGLDKLSAHYPGRPKMERDRQVTRRAFRELPVAALIDAPAPLNLDIFAVGPNQCRYPVDGEGYKTLFCGHVTPKGSSYCGFHSSIAYNPPGYRDPRDKFVRGRVS